MRTATHDDIFLFNVSLKVFAMSPSFSKFLPVKRSLCETFFTFVIFFAYKSSFILSFLSFFSFFLSQHTKLKKRPQPFSVESYRACGVILCSSGTTALSKGVMLSIAQCIQMTAPFPQLMNPTLLCFSSLYWLSGFTMLIFSLANVSKRVITKRKFSSLLFAHLIEQYKVNVVLAPPSQIAMFVQSPVMRLADLSSIRLFFVGGGFLGKELREILQDHLLYGTLIVTYAMTEIGRTMAMTFPFQAPSNSTGKIAPNLKLKVEEMRRMKIIFTSKNFVIIKIIFQVVSDDEETLGLNETGEIRVMSQIRFLGYANKPEETRDAFDEQGWFKTGDLGYFTEDGEIFIVDRKKEMIKYLNYQVSPSELESHISKMDGVTAVCVVGIPDIISGDLPTAVIVKAKNSSLEEEDILDEVTRESSKIYNFPLTLSINPYFFHFKETFLNSNDCMEESFLSTNCQ
jgi:4-coumarate--CoA ligase